MSGDIDKGRTEIDNFNGHLIELAAGRGCDMNLAVQALVKRMETQRLSPGLHRLARSVRSSRAGTCATT